MLVVNAVAFPLFWAADAVLARLTQPRAPALRPLSDQDPPRWMDPDQRAAYQMALRHPLCVITGGPGSGKSRVAAAIAAAARASGARVHIAAPTGMAAHVAESHLQAVNGSGIPTSTVHRLIASAAHTADGLKIVGLDLLIIDESSMLDIVTFGRLCHRLPRDTRIVLVGDPLQLPAVGPGNILADLAGLGAYMAGKGLPSVSVPVARLTRNHRAAGTGGAAIAELARAIASGGAPQSLWPFRGVRMIDVTGKTAAAAEAAVIREATRLAASGTPPLVLTPFVGTARRLNEALRPLLNSTANRGAARLREPYDRGDRIVQIRNKGPLANGDLGEIVDVQPASGPAAVYVVEFDSGVVAHCHVDPAVTEPDDSPSPPHVVEHVGLITLAYALTVHKGQGSESKSCIVYIPPEKDTGAGPEPTEASRHLSRRLLYTALTRAREELVVVAPRAVFEEALRTDGIPRRSRLLYRIRSLLAPRAASAAAAVPLRRFVSVPGAASGAAPAPRRRVRPQKAALRRALARAARP
jgi:exodeoxyribonuclease V alpha subunit